MLSMKGNLLTTVDDTGDDFRRLGELYLDNNQFEKLDESVSSLPEGLVILSMNYNPIRSIDNDYFHNLREHFSIFACWWYWSLLRSLRWLKQCKIWPKMASDFKS